MTIWLITVKPDLLDCTENVRYNYEVGNTVGSLSTTLQNFEWSYLAGFFDGDGSLMVQLKNRRDTVRGWRIMFTVCFYQDKRHEEILHEIRDLLNIGYVNIRNDGMAELRINGYEQNLYVLENMKPYIKFKKKQVNYAIKILKVINNVSFKSIPKTEKALLADWFNGIRAENYKSSGRKHSPEEIKALLMK